MKGAEASNRLEANGGISGNAEDFLALTERERKAVDLRLRLSRAVKEIRVARGLTQRQLGKAIGSTQANAGLVEMGSVRVSLDLTFRAFFELGGTLEGLASGNVMPQGVTVPASGASRSPVSRVRKTTSAGGQSKAKEPKPARRTAGADSKT